LTVVVKCQVSPGLDHKVALAGLSLADLAFTATQDDKAYHQVHMITISAILLLATWDILDEVEALLP
jgi:hypothetical protein